MIVAKLSQRSLQLPYRPTGIAGTGSPITQTSSGLNRGRLHSGLNDALQSSDVIGGTHSHTSSGLGNRDRLHSGLNDALQLSDVIGGTHIHTSSWLGNLARLHSGLNDALQLSDMGLSP